MAKTKTQKSSKVMTLRALIMHLQELEKLGVSPNAKIVLAGDAEGNSMTYMKQASFWTSGMSEDATSWNSSVEFTPVESNDAIPYADSLVLWPG